MLLRAARPDVEREDACAGERYRAVLEDSRGRTDVRVVVRGTLKVVGYGLVAIAVSCALVLLILGPTELCRVETGFPIRDVLFAAGPILLLAGLVLTFGFRPRPTGLYAIALLVFPPFVLLLAVGRLVGPCLD